MAYSPPNEDTVVVCGGLGDCSDAAELNGGGVTKAAWDDNSPTDFIDTNGGPVAGAADCSFTTATKVLLSLGMGATYVVIGTLAYVSAGDGGHITPGIYEITAHTTDTITCAGIVDDGNNDTGVTVNVGGAIDTLQHVFDNDVNDAADYNRYIYINGVSAGIGTITIAATIDIDTGGGALASNSWKKIIGCNTDFTPLTNGNYLTLTAAGTDFAGTPILSIDNLENILLKNIWLKDNDGNGGTPASGEDGLFIVNNGTPRNVVLDNCKVTNCYRGIFWGDPGGSGLLVIDSFIDVTDYAIRSIASNGTILNSFLKSASGDYCCFPAYRHSTISNTIIVGGLYGILLNQTDGGSTVILNCSFYGQTAGCTYNGGVTFTNLIVMNSIVQPESVIDHCFRYGGGSKYDDYIFTTCTTNNLPTGDDSQDSLAITQIGFVDPANDDFRLLPTSYLLNRGMPTPGKTLFTEQGYTTPGAWQRKSFLGID